MTSMSQSQLEANDINSTVQISLDQVSHTLSLKAPRPIPCKMPRSVYCRKEPRRIKSIFDDRNLHPFSQEAKHEQLSNKIENKKEKRRSLKRKSKSSSPAKESPKYVQRKCKMKRKEGNYGHLYGDSFEISKAEKPKQEEQNKNKHKRSRKSNCNPNNEIPIIERVRKVPKNKYFNKQKRTKVNKEENIKKKSANPSLNQNKSIEFTANEIAKIDRNFEERERLFKQTGNQSYLQIYKKTNEVIYKLIYWDDIEQANDIRIIDYMSGNVYWHLISNQYFPVGFHTRAKFKNEDILKDISKILYQKKDFTFEKNIYPNFCDHYVIRDKIEVIRNECYNFVKYALTSGSINNKEYVNSIIPGNGNKIDNLSNKVRVLNIDKVIDLLDMSCQKLSQDNENCLKEICENFSKIKTDMNDEDSTELVMNSENVYELGEQIYFDYMKHYSKLFDSFCRESFKTLIKKPKRIKLSTKENYLLDVGGVEIEEEKRLIREQSKKSKYGANTEIYKQFQVRADESICQICNSGDYQSDNEIVYCEECKVCVHQKCYGTGPLPEDDWICITCSVFGSYQAQYLQCAICPNKGGPMKPTKILSCDDLLIQTGTGIGEKAYQNKIKKYLNETDNDLIEKDSSETVEDCNQKKQAKKSRFELIMRKCKLNRKHRSDNKLFKTEDSKLAYDSVIKKEQKIQKLVFGNKYKEKLKIIYQKDIYNDAILPSFYAWTHLSCCIFTQELQCSNEKIIRLSKLNKERLSKPCYICRKYNRRSQTFNYGSTVNCSEQKCELHFHVECARRRDLHMIIKQLDANGTKDTEIYCEKHTPFTISKELEFK